MSDSFFKGTIYVYIYYRPIQKIRIRVDFKFLSQNRKSPNFK